MLGAIKYGGGGGRRAGVVDLEAEGSVLKHEPDPVSGVGRERKDRARISASGLDEADGDLAPGQIPGLARKKAVEVVTGLIGAWSELEPLTLLEDGDSDV